MKRTKLYIISLFSLFFALSPIKANLENIFIPQQSKDTIEIVEYINIAKQFHDSETPNYDSALYYLNKALDTAESQSNEFLTYRIYNIFADLSKKTQNYSLAIEYYFKMLYLLDKKENIQSNPDILFQYALLYRFIGANMAMNDNEKALDYFMKSLSVIDKLEELNPLYPDLHKNKLFTYNNIESSSIGIGDYETAAEYCEKALHYPVTIDHPAYYASLYSNLGVVNWELGNHEESFDYYNKSLLIREETGDEWGKAINLFNLGKCYYHLNDYKTAIEILNSALEQSRKVSHTQVELYISEVLALIYKAQNNYKKMAEMLELQNTLKDSVASVEKINDIASIEMQYLLRKQLEESELKQQILVSQKEQKELLSVFIAIVLFFLLFVFFLLYNNQRTKNKKNFLEKTSLALQNENLELKNLQLKQTLDNKTSELNTHMKYLLKKNEFVTSIIENVTEIKDQNKDQIQTVIKDIKGNIESSVWNEFSLLFQDLHQDFYQQLYKEHPNLTPNEKKLCAFIRLNLSTKEISSITFQSPPTIEIARSRLRKKLNLSRQDNLALYLSKF